MAERSVVSEERVGCLFVWLPFEPFIHLLGNNTSVAKDGNPIGQYKTTQNGPIFQSAYTKYPAPTEARHLRQLL